MAYYVGVPVTYTAVPVTPGFLASDHTLSWTFDDTTTGSGATLNKIWATQGTHSAMVTAINAKTHSTATASKSISVAPIPAPSMPIAQWKDVKLSKLSGYGAAVVGYATSSTSILVTSDYGVSWAAVTGTPAFPQTGDASEMDSSRDGSIVYITDSIGYIYKSSDQGTTWASLAAAGSRDWIGLCCSGDGQIIYAVIRDGLVAYRSIDGGASWTTPTVPNNHWADVAASQDGATVVATGSSGFFNTGVYLSTDSGSTWSATSLGLDNWFGVAVSSSGSHIVVGNRNSIWISTDNGASFAVSSAPAGLYRHIECSDDARVILASFSNSVAVSTDYGATWSTSTFGTGVGIEGISVSADGVWLSACTYNGYIWVSLDSGVTWIQR